MTFTGVILDKTTSNPPILVVVVMVAIHDSGCALGTR